MGRVDSSTGLGARRVTARAAEHRYAIRRCAGATAPRNKLRMMGRMGADRGQWPQDRPPHAPPRPLAYLARLAGRGAAAAVDAVRAGDGRAADREVRGTDLRVEAARQPLPPGLTPALPFLAPDQPEVAELHACHARRRNRLRGCNYPDGSAALFDAASGAQLSPLGAAEAREVAMRGMWPHGRDRRSPRCSPPTKVPFDFRKACRSGRLR